VERRALVAQGELGFASKLGSVLIATCVMSASPLAAVAGSSLGNSGSARAGHVPHPLALTLTASPAAAAGTQRRSFAIGQARYDLGSPEIPLGLASAGATVENDSKVAFPVRWQKPELERVVRSFRRTGLPIVHLWGSGRNVLAIGLNPHGVPGVYFTQKLSD
jgi:hypothetical protein